MNAGRPTAIDLFCGAGGLSEGFRQAGFQILAGNDIDPYAAETYAATHRDSQFIPGPIEDLKAPRLLRVAGLVKGELDCLLGGPPCQGYSVYNHQRGLHDARSHLFEEYLRIVAGLMPRWVVMENVTGITSIANGMVVETILRSLRKLGYTVELRLARAEEYGIPQERRRVLFIGNRLGLPIPRLDATHGPGLKPFVPVWDAIGDLPRLKNGEAAADGASYRTEAKSAYQQNMRRSGSGVLNHSAPKLAPVNLKRMQHIPEGGSWRDIPVALLPNGMKRARRSDHTKRYGRLEKKGLSSTILTKCDVHWGAYIHPEQDRSLTVREAARLQSFPDWFEFKGPRTEQYIQVGNAVPPVLGKFVAAEILRAGKPVRAVSWLPADNWTSRKFGLPVKPENIVGEVLGVRAARGVDPAATDYRCPFLDSRCVKRSTAYKGEPYPVCSIWQGNKEPLDAAANLICVCPKRFYAVDFYKDVIANCWPWDPPKNPKIAPEVKMAGFGNVDFVIADMLEDNSIGRFLSVELQAIDITGSVARAYEALKADVLLDKRPTYGLNWDNVYKRYITQLIRKGYFHHHWKSKIVAVIQDQIYRDIVKRADFMRSSDVKADTVNIIFLTYRFENDPERPGQFKPVLATVEGTSHANLQQAVLYKDPPSRDAFCERIKASAQRSAFAKEMKAALGDLFEPET